MSYTPPIEKLAAMGFSPTAAVYTDETRFLRYQDAYDAPGLEWFVSIYPDGQVQLLEGGGWGGAEHGDPVFIGRCPSEGFFDQLVLAVGFPA